MSRLKFGLLYGLISLTFPAISFAGDCRSLNPPTNGVVEGKRLITPEDLLRLRDIGPVENGNTRAPILSVSPDGRLVAFQLRQVDAEKTGYCLGVYVLGIHGGDLRRIDQGGEPILTTFSAWGFVENVPNGTIAPAAPQLAPDGLSVAYLRRDNGVTQVWRARADGSGAQPVTHLRSDVEAFHWSADGRSIVLDTRPSLVTARESIAAEGANGYLYNERFVPAASSVPMPREPMDVQRIAVDLATGGTSPSDAPPPAPEAALLTASDVGGSLAWTTRAGDDLKSPIRLHVRRAGMVDRNCVDPLCDGIVDLWWSHNHQSILYLRREGWRLSQLGLYSWSPAAGRPHRIWGGDDVLMGCQVAGGDLLCAQESSLQPRRLVRIDLETGLMLPVFDPNPEFRNLALGSVERLKWTNAFGIDTFGDLVLPPGYHPGVPLPLIVVQYESRGFLRGGTGDDYPIQAFAARGYAVLSFQRPMDVAYYKGGESAAESNRLDRIGWADRRSVQSSIEIAVKDLIGRGIVDPAKVGITGLSDGASMVQFALVNSRLFAASAISTCCEESSPINLMDGPAVGPVLNAAGYPSLLHEDDAFWRPMSFRLNAHDIQTPILMQLADREYLGALEGYGALKEAGAPVEMYVFPDEYHIKWHPEHRLATYVRVLDWFDFWLKGRADPDPSKQAQYTRWRGLNASASPITDVTPGPR
jgi:dipeptidyl aminopeptidase/acylaminoacyl peptidase